MSGLLAPRLVSEPGFGSQYDYGQTVQILDEAGCFAGFDVTIEQIRSVAAENGITGEQFARLESSTLLFHDQMAISGLRVRCMDRHPEGIDPRPCVLLLDDPTDDGIQDDLAVKYKRYTDEEGDE